MDDMPHLSKLLEGVPPETYQKDLRTSLAFISGEMISQALAAGKSGDAPECERLLREAETFLEQTERPRIRALAAEVARGANAAVADAAAKTLRDIEQEIAWQHGAIAAIRGRYSNRSEV